jgi:hypothetical protein
MFLQVRRRVDDHDARLLARDEEDVHGIGRKEAGLARLHLEFLAADLDVRLAFDRVAK